MLIYASYNCLSIAILLQHKYRCQFPGASLHLPLGAEYADRPIRRCRTQRLCQSCQSFRRYGEHLPADTAQILLGYAPPPAGIGGNAGVILPYRGPRRPMNPKACTGKMPSSAAPASDRPGQSRGSDRSCRRWGSCDAAPYLCCPSLFRLSPQEPLNKSPHASRRHVD